MKLNPWMAALATSLTVAFSNTALAADPFPSRPLRIIVPVAAGGWGDLSTRIIAQKLGKNWESQS